MAARARSARGPPALLPGARQARPGAATCGCSARVPGAARRAGGARRSRGQTFGRPLRARGGGGGGSVRSGQPQAPGLNAGGGRAPDSTARRARRGSPLTPGKRLAGRLVSAVLVLGALIRFSPPPTPIGTRGRE